MVRETARRLGYRPNRTARNFLQRRHGAIGLLVHSLWKVPDTVLAFMFRRARRLDYMLLLEEGPREPGPLPKLLAEDCVDGLIVFSANGQARAVRSSLTPTPRRLKAL